jgi:hypothetical protein
MPPKFALDQKIPLRSLQRPPGGGTAPVGNHGSRQCGVLNISQCYGPVRPVREIAIVLHAGNTTAAWVKCSCA